ncbi:40S ribosomal protein S12, mitochondrial-like [Limulus polyphemus]|uniref:Small ribosomal subunit protein uS12m n=1 Tax=Limulus polyphemus TaxID=6850 RepID=A0ABM1SQ12_LIMPO|nr:40S ribosomal protein S12, mitochondrial-like [Limulus polyphemus]XP_022245718.1 40S ribosomal protein S12, mitochondrial-like [Limulus polyphemus]
MALYQSMFGCLKSFFRCVGRTTSSKISGVFPSSSSLTIPSAVTLSSYRFYQPCFLFNSGICTSDFFWKSAPGFSFKSSLFLTPLLAPPRQSQPSAGTVRMRTTLLRLHKNGPHIKKRKKKRPLDGRPQMKGVVLKTLIKKPKKPNSANRKCVLLRLSNGREAVAYVPGEGHNLQEHNIVLVRCGRCRDVPGVKLKVIRGKYDCAHVVKRSQV